VAAPTPAAESFTKSRRFSREGISDSPSDCASVEGKDTIGTAAAEWPEHCRTFGDKSRG
jgi:hypothetical protein